MAGRLGFAAAAAAFLAAACGGASRSGVRTVGGDLVIQPSAIDFGLGERCVHPKALAPSSKQAISEREV